jgi:dienelactone hydrolase
VSALEGWVESSFNDGKRSYPTYRRGTGPGVVIIHEIPGITPKVQAFAERVVDAGFTVVMPSLLGTPGREVSNGYALQSVVKMCVSNEFTKLALGESPPIATWLRVLAKSLHIELGGPGVGALGMCFSGGFALAMMVDDCVVAPVLSQPSAPLSPFGKSRAASVNLSLGDLVRVKERAVAGCDVLGLRYTGDALVGTRFDTLRRELGDRFIAVEFASTTKKDHSVLTEQIQEEAVTKVLAFFHDKLSTR